MHLFHNQRKTARERERERKRANIYYKEIYVQFLKNIFKKIDLQLCMKRKIKSRQI